MTRRRLRRRPLSSLAAVAILLLEGLLAALLDPVPALSALAVVVAPGLAVAPHLPAELRRPSIAVPLVPISGVAVSSIVLITMSALEVPLGGVEIRVALLAIAVAALAGTFAGTASVPEESPRTAAATLLLLGSVTLVAIAMQSLVLGEKPLPGQDWGSYLLYAQEIERHGALLIDNPFWMLGGDSFAQDPGAPSLYGAHLILSGEDPSSLLQGLWLFAVLSVLAVFVWTATLWGPFAGIVAAALYCVTPTILDLLSWHGLANVYALVVLPVVLLAAGVALRGDAGRRWSAVFGIALVALATTHRFSFALGLTALAFPLAAALVRRPRETARFLAWSAAFAAVAGFGVAVDLARRNADLGGLPGYRTYLPTRIEWDHVVRDVTGWLAIAGLVALVVVLAARPFRRDRARLVLAGLGLAILAWTYAWIVHVPAGYNRAAFFLPLLLAPPVGILLSRLPTRVAAPLALGLTALVALRAADLASDFRGFYGYTNASSLTGLGYVQERASPGEPVVTDLCWAFLTPWLLQRPVLAALEPALTLAGRELAPAETARQILYERNGERLARRYGIRYALVDPQCTSQDGEYFGPPRSGRLVYASTRLLVFDLGAAAAR